MKLPSLKSFLGLVALVSMTGCSVNNPEFWEPAKYPKSSAIRDRLVDLPGPGQRLAVAVYGFTDQTGQFKTSDSVQTLSRAVTQGATSILVKTLQDAGHRNWFQVIEREKLDNVLRERAVIREMRASYLNEKQVNPDALPPLLFAGVLLEGGIISYDSNTKTGGFGGRFLGIGGSTQYREDTVTIYLRAVSVKTGEVLSTVSVRKSIASVGVGADAFRFVDFKDLLEIETGITYNEPDQIALSQAIEKAVYGLIMEGAMTNLWCINTSDEESSSLLLKYVSERDNISVSDARLPLQANGQPRSGACPARKAALVSVPLPRPVEPQAKVTAVAAVTNNAGRPAEALAKGDKAKTKN